MATAAETSVSPPRPKIRPIPPRSSSSYDSNASMKKKLDRSALLDRMNHQQSAGLYDGQVPLSTKRKRGRSELYNDNEDDRYLNPKTVKSSENGGSFSNSLTGSFQRGDDEDDVDDVMKDSMFSDVNYRRNCGSTAEEEESSRDELDNRGGKRRLLDVVGSVIGAWWEFCKSQAPALSTLVLPSRFLPASGPEYFDTPYNMPPEMFENEIQNQRENGDTSPSQTMPGALPSHDMFNQSYVSNSSLPSTASAAPMSPSSRKHRPPALSNVSSPSSRKSIDRKMSNSWVVVPPDPSGASAAGNPVASKASAASTRYSKARPSTPIYTSTFPVMVRRNGTFARMPFRGAKKSFSDDKVGAAGSGHGGPGGSRKSAASAPSSPGRSSARSSGASEVSMRGGNLRRAPINGAFTSEFVPNLPGGAGELRSTPSLRKQTEADADQSIRNFNKRLRDMIREGKEALGSTIEVYDCEEEWDDEVPQLNSSISSSHNNRATATVWR